MQHSFDISIATKYGVNVAIFLNNLAFWIQKNIANERHYYDGRYWTYNSQAAFLKIFPYWSRKTLRTTIEAAKKHGLIIQGNYNKLAFDKTTWYALSETGLSLFPILNASQPEKKLIGLKRPTGWPESANRNAENGHTIPDSKPDKKTYTTDEPSTSAVECTPVHMDKKEDIKEYNNTNEANASIISSKKQNQEIIDIYHEELPNSPKVEFLGETLNTQLNNMKRNWKSKYSHNQLPFSLESFRSYLKHIKQQYPWFIEPYNTPSGRIVINNLRTITRPKNLEKFRNNEFA